MLTKDADKLSNILFNHIIFLLSTQRQWVLAYIDMHFIAHKSGSGIKIVNFRLPSLLGRVDEIPCRQNVLHVTNYNLNVGKFINSKITIFKFVNTK